MSVEAIKSQITALKAVYQSIAPVSLRACVEAAYAQDALHNLEVIFNETPPSATKLIRFLERNWALTKGTMVCVTAAPESPFSLLFCDLAEWAANGTTKHPLSLLMPTIELESTMRTDYPHLSEIPLRTVLKTHILGEDNLHLIPIRLLTELDLYSTPEMLRMPYVSAERYKDHDAYTVTSNEFKRLAEHTPLTQSLLDSRNEYQLLSGDTSHLLGQLQRLCLHLGTNAVNGGGTGSETNAGAGAYPAIIHFMSYYDKLGTENALRIPRALKESIDRFLALVSDPLINIDPSVQLETCIATRRTNVMDAMAGHESLLRQISLTGAKKDALMENAQTDFNTAQQELTRAIDTSQYSGGRDKLNITTPLLAALNVQLQISSLSDLETIKTLSAPEITDVLKDDNLSDDIVNTLSTVENLVVFITETSPEKSAVFLQNLSSRLIGRLIKSPMDLSALLISLDLEKCKIAYQSLGRVIRSEQGLDTVLKHLSSEQKAAVMSVVPEAFRITFQFYQLREGFLPLHERTVIFEKIRGHLPALINSFDLLMGTLRNVGANNRIIVLDMIKDQIPGLITTKLQNSNPDDEVCHLFQVLQDLPLEEREHLFNTVFEPMRKKWHGQMIRSGVNAVRVTQYLPPDLRNRLMDALPDGVRLECQYYLLSLGASVCGITNEERKTMLECLNDDLYPLIEHFGRSSDIINNCFFKHLSRHEFIFSLDLIKEQCKDLSISFVVDLMQAQPSKARLDAFFNAVKSTVVINNSSPRDLIYHKGLFSREQRLALVSAWPEESQKEYFLKMKEDCSPSGYLWLNAMMVDSRHQGIAAVVIVAAAIAAVRQDPITLMTVSVAAAVVATVGFFSQITPNPQAAETVPDLRPAN